MPYKRTFTKVLVASQEILLQTYVAERPPKPDTYPVFLIQSHIGIIGSYTINLLGFTSSREYRNI